MNTNYDSYAEMTANFESPYLSALLGEDVATPTESEPVAVDPNFKWDYRIEDPHWADSSCHVCFADNVSICIFKDYEGKGDYLDICLSACKGIGCYISESEALAEVYARIDRPIALYAEALIEAWGATSVVERYNGVGKRKLIAELDKVKHALEFEYLTTGPVAVTTGPVAVKFEPFGQDGAEATGKGNANFVVFPDITHCTMEYITNFCLRKMADGRRNFSVMNGNNDEYFAYVNGNGLLTMYTSSICDSPYFAIFGSVVNITRDLIIAEAKKIASVLYEGDEPRGIDIIDGETGEVYAIIGSDGFCEILVD